MFEFTKDQKLDIIYQDEQYVAINKPSGMLVHRSEITEQSGVYAMLLLRDQLNQHVYPCHRLDRPTSGVLIFALNPVSCQKMQALIQNKEVEKEYYAIVRGWLESEVMSNPVKSKYDKEYKEAETDIQVISRTEIEIPVGRYEKSRYSLVKAMPKTGRTHQIRLHLKSAFHPIIGDTRYGDNKHNHMFEEKFQNHRLLLHASSLKFKHPITNKEVFIEAEFPIEFKKIISNLDLKINI